MGRATARRVRRAGDGRTARVRQPLNRATLLRIADERVTRELRAWVAAVAFVLAILSIPWVMGYIALATGAMS